MWGKVLCGVVAAFVAVIVAYCTNFYCHGGFYSPHNYLATKTPYFQPRSLSYHAGHEDCEAVQIWMVVRHGTRNPSAKVIRKMRTLLPPLRNQIVKAHENGQGDLCDQELELLKKWEIPEALTESEEKKLVEQGRKELEGIGRRFKYRFPQLLGQKYSRDIYKFKFTKTERAEASCVHFVREIVGKDDASSVFYPLPLAADPILRFYKACPRWKQEVDKNPEAYKERRLFETSPTFQSVRDNFLRRTGLESDDSEEGQEALLDSIEAIYMTCAFETAWNPGTTSPWCHLFDGQDLDKMQYRQDLEYYWIDGYGYEITYKQACPAVIDMVQHFQQKIENDKHSPSLIAYFTHSGTLLKLISRLGLFNDTTRLLHNNYHEHSRRQWKTNEIDMFATNIAAVLYKCPEEKYKVGLLFQEEPVPVPGCTDALCPFQKFLEIYHSVINDCDIPQICGL